MSKKRYLTAKEATTLLGISATTLYAYVSRGLIFSEASPENSRERRYRAEDVQRLLDRKAQRRDPAQAVQEALHWGAPILESALTLITENALYYRGHDVRTLAQLHSFEEVAALLWTESMDHAMVLFDTPLPFPLPAIPADSPIAKMKIALALTAEQDLAAYTLTPENCAQTGARILHLLTYALTGDPVFAPMIAATLARAWQVESILILNTALILCADHELNASSFAARVIASAEATPYAVVAGGLAALEGIRHGGLTRRTAAFLREVEQAGSPLVVIRERLQRGDTIPGFGHPLYPNGDPRAVVLLELLKSVVPEQEFTLSEAVIGDMQKATGEAPTIDFALVVMERALHLPPDSALALFGLGRTAGWIAHAIEQYSVGQLIRPRAKYVGQLPTEG
ncbi:MAG: citrate synthase family protein [Chloroflexota bacterium]